MLKLCVSLQGWRAAKEHVSQFIFQVNVDEVKHLTRCKFSIII